MAKKLGKLGIFGAGLFATGPLLVACGGGPNYDEWAATDGAAGRINLDDVQEAFKKSDSVTEFEQRVNEIYEGDGLIYIRASQDGEALTLEGWEDLIPHDALPRSLRKLHDTVQVPHNRHEKARHESGDDWPPGYVPEQQPPPPRRRGSARVSQVSDDGLRTAPNGRRPLASWGEAQPADTRRDVVDQAVGAGHRQSEK